jgi:hypothetical protein
MTRRKGSSPTLELEITAEQWDRAVRASSGGCLIADAMKVQYPELSRIVVDMATVRASDNARGERYTYLTPPDAQHLLLAFDQGWSCPTDQVTIRRAVHVRPIKTQRKKTADRVAARDERRAAVEAKVERGEPLTKSDKLVRAAANREPLPPPDRPTSHGPVEAVEQTSGGRITIVGGESPITGPARTNPNLLHGHNRLFGARTAEPALAFTEAVEKAVAERLTEQT